MSRSPTPPDLPMDVARANSDDVTANNDVISVDNSTKKRKKKKSVWSLCSRSAGAAGRETDQSSPTITTRSSPPEASSSTAAAAARAAGGSSPSSSSGVAILSTHSPKSDSRSSSRSDGTENSGGGKKAKKRSERRKATPRFSLRRLFYGSTMVAQPLSSSSAAAYHPSPSNTPPAAPPLASRQLSKRSENAAAAADESASTVWRDLSSCSSSLQGAAGSSVAAAVDEVRGASGGGAGNKECPLCLHECGVEMFPLLRNCAHLFCINCLQTYVRIEIQEGRVNLKCPQCSESMHPNDIEHLIGDKNSNLLTLYESLMLRRLLSIDPDTRWCPGPNCTFAVIAAGCASCPKITCERPGCGYSFCYHCKAEWHPNQTCDAARAQRHPTAAAAAAAAMSLRSQSFSFESAAAAASNVVGVATGTGGGAGGGAVSIDMGNQQMSEAKVCPRCNTLIVKMDDGSCNHMTCAVCGTEFCWLCMKEISDLHYLSPSGCTFWGKKPWSRKKKLFWQLGTLVGAPVGIALLAGIAVPAMIIGIPCWVGRKIHNLKSLRKANKHKRNLAVVGGVVSSMVVSPLLAGLAVSIGVPILLCYVYGIVPIALCRSEGCGVYTSVAGVRIDVDEKDEFTANNVAAAAAASAAAAFFGTGASGGSGNGGGRDNEASTSKGSGLGKLGGAGSSSFGGAVGNQDMAGTSGAAAAAIASSSGGNSAGISDHVVSFRRTAVQSVGSGAHERAETADGGVVNPRSCLIANPSIGEVSLGASLSMGSACHLEERDDDASGAFDRESASNTAMAGASIAGSVASSSRGVGAGGSGVGVSVSVGGGKGIGHYHIQHRLEVGADIHATGGGSGGGVGGHRKKGGGAMSFSSERLSETVSLSERSATISLAGDTGDGARSEASTRGLAGSIIAYKMGDSQSVGSYKVTGVSLEAAESTTGEVDSAAAATTVAVSGGLGGGDVDAASFKSLPLSTVAAAAAGGGKHQQGDQSQQTVARSLSPVGGSGGNSDAEDTEAAGKPSWSLGSNGGGGGGRSAAANKRFNARRQRPSLDKQMSNSGNITTICDDSISERVRFDDNVSFIDAAEHTTTAFNHGHGDGGSGSAADLGGGCVTSHHSTSGPAELKKGVSMVTPIGANVLAVNESQQQQHLSKESSAAAVDAIAAAAAPSSKGRDHVTLLSVGDDAATKKDQTMSLTKVSEEM